MLGERSGWAANVRAAQGHARLLHGRREHVRLVELPAIERAPIPQRYLEVAGGARAQVPVDRSAPLSDLEAIAARFPVFRIEPAPAAPSGSRRAP